MRISSMSAGRVDIAGQYEGAVSQPRDAGLISAGIDVQDADGAGIYEREPEYLAGLCV